MTKADPNVWALERAVTDAAALRGWTLRGVEPWDRVGEFVQRLRETGATEAASAIVRAFYRAEDADGPSIVPLGVGMRWPACSAWLGRNVAWEPEASA